MSSSPFEALSKFTYVIFYDNRDKAFLELVKHIDENHTMVDLSASEKLKLLCLNHYGLRELPFMLYRGAAVYSSSNVTSQLDSIDIENTEKYRAFISEFVSPEGLTVFIKGTIEQPRCKFSRQLIRLLEESNIAAIKEFDILSDQNLRHYIKSITNWPTFPQIFINGCFLGGLDKFVELVENGGLN